MELEPLPPRNNERIRLPGNISTPEQGCVGCAVFAAMLAISVGFWLFYWWRNEPNLHFPTATPTPAIHAVAPRADIPASRYNNRPIPQNP